MASKKDAERNLESGGAIIAPISLFPIGFVKKRLFSVMSQVAPVTFVTDNMFT